MSIAMLIVSTTPGTQEETDHHNTGDPMAQHRTPTPPRIRRLIAGLAAAGAVTLGGAGLAYADPDFGPGNSSKGPQDAGAICHPPGQTDGFPACEVDE
jgi:hypothetical protein